jgi:hypothetical protein
MLECDGMPKSDSSVSNISFVIAILKLSGLPLWLSKDIFFVWEKQTEYNKQKAAEIKSLIFMLLILAVF